MRNLDLSKFVLSRTRALILGLALIVLTNAVVLAGVAYNRSGEPESVLRLTERELSIRYWSWPSNDNSSIDLDLRWRVAAPEQGKYGTWYGGLTWLTSEQLRELGFEVEGDVESEQAAERLRRQSSRRGWLVLEHDGAAYKQSLQHAQKELERATALAATNAGDDEFQKRLETTRAELEREEKTESRLFVVDVGRDEDALRAKYPDRQRYAIVRGRIGVDVEGAPGERRLLGRIVDMDTEVIRVPHEFRAIVEPYVQPEGYPGYSSERPPRYAATVNFGRRFEPWIVTLAEVQPD